MKLLSRLGLLAATFATALGLVACGGDSHTPPNVLVTSDLNVKFTPANKAAAFALLTSSASGFDYPSGVTLGTTAFPAPVNIKVAGPDADNMTFTMTYGTGSTAGTATGTLVIGSCIFKIPNGPDAGEYTAINCSTEVELANRVFTPNDAIVSGVKLAFDNFASAWEYFHLTVSATGVVAINAGGNSTIIGTVAVTPTNNPPSGGATGATGGT